MTESNDCVRLEGITSVSALIRAVREGCARRRILRVLIDSGKRKTEHRRVAFLEAAARELGFPIEFIPPDTAASLGEGRTHGGFFAEATPAVFPGAEDLHPSGTGFSVLLEGAEDPYSLAHSVRALYSAGASELILPCRFPNGADTTLARASAGCTELLPIYVCDPAEAVRRYADAGYSVAAAGLRDAKDLCDCPIRFPVLLVIGGEKRGISAAVSAMADTVLRIPYARDFMGSLPTETAVSVFAYELMCRTREARLRADGQSSPADLQK